MIHETDPLKIILILDEMKIRDSVRERIVGLFDGTYKVPKGVNCWGTALFVARQIDEPAFVHCNKELVLSYLSKAKAIPYGKKCGDLIIDHDEIINHDDPKDPHRDEENFLHHVLVYLDHHNRANLVFHKDHTEAPFCIESFPTATEYCYNLHTYRFDSS
jgi:hypothetical protein